MKEADHKPITALVMTGGGARAAYQVGVLKAVRELLPKDAANPFPILCGTSAGAINAATLATYARDFHRAVRRLNRVWRNFHVEQVFRADAWGIAKSGARWLAAMFLGGLGRRNPASLLDRAPLYELLSNHLPCEGIQDSIDADALRAVSITASGYTSGESISFFQGESSLKPWRRARRFGMRSDICIDHLMASSAIPFLFGAVKIHREYFGDGSMRQHAPISPALHLGADRVLVIGVHKEVDEQEKRRDSLGYPTLAEIGGHVLNSIFLDSLDDDLERLQRINQTVSGIPPEDREKLGIKLRVVDTLIISPSEDLGAIAERHAHHLPWPVRFVLRGVGAFNASGASLVSYLLFEKSYCRELIGLGYADAMQQKEELQEFLFIENA